MFRLINNLKSLELQVNFCACFHYYIHYSLYQFVVSKQPGPFPWLNRSYDSFLSFQQFVPRTSSSHLFCFYRLEISRLFSSFKLSLQSDSPFLFFTFPFFSAFWILYHTPYRYRRDQNYLQSGRVEDLVVKMVRKIVTACYVSVAVRARSDGLKENGPERALQNELHRCESKRWHQKQNRGCSIATRDKRFLQETSIRAEEC